MRERDLQAALESSQLVHASYMDDQGVLGKLHFSHGACLLSRILSFPCTYHRTWRSLVLVCAEGYTPKCLELEVMFSEVAHRPGPMQTIPSLAVLGRPERGRAGEALRGLYMMVRLISATTRIAKAQAAMRQTANSTLRLRADPSKGASARALVTASTATQASVTTTDAVERKPPLVMGSTIHERSGPLAPMHPWAKRVGGYSCELRVDGVLRS